jgi:hypothetical protein
MALFATDNHQGVALVSDNSDGGMYSPKFVQTYDNIKKTMGMVVHEGGGAPKDFLYS